MQKYTVVVSEEGTIYWYKERTEILHRENGPAIKYADGSKSWYQNGKLHRLDGPAKESVNGDKFWYQNGELHRLDGPAVEWPDGNKEWFIEGQNYSEEAFNQMVEKFNNDKILKSFYDKNNKLSSDAVELQHKIFSILEPIFQEQTSKGYSARELSHLISSCAFDIECKTCM